MYDFLINNSGWLNLIFSLAICVYVLRNFKLQPK